MERGSADKIFINTTGIGYITDRLVGPEQIRPGDEILISGTIGDHGIVILSEREGLEFQTPVVQEGKSGLVLLETPLRGKRIMGMLEGEHLPRIC